MSLTLGAIKIPLLSRLLDQLGDQSRPACLMAGSDACSVVAVEVFIERDCIVPMAMALKDVNSPEYRPPARFILEEDMRESP